MYIMYPETIQFYIDGKEGKEIVGFAESYVDDEEIIYRNQDNFERNDIRTLLMNIDDEYVDEMVNKY